MRTDDEVCVFIKLNLRSIAICALQLCLFLASASLNAADFYVSPTGSDANPGTKSQPFASLERARDAVRVQKQRKPNRDYTVLIRGGVYRLEETVVFSLQDSASGGSTIGNRCGRASSNR